MHCNVQIRDQIVGNNLVRISYWAILRYRDLACTASIGGYMAAVRHLLRPHNHCLTTLDRAAVNENTLLYLLCLWVSSAGLRIRELTDTSVGGVQRGERGEGVMSDNCSD